MNVIGGEDRLKEIQREDLKRWVAETTNRHLDFLNLKPVNTIYVTPEFFDKLKNFMDGVKA